MTQRTQVILYYTKPYAVVNTSLQDSSKQAGFEYFFCRPYMYKTLAIMSAYIVDLYGAVHFNDDIVTSCGDTCNRKRSLRGFLILEKSVNNV